MPRPIKQGLDYFPQDTDLFNDRKIRRLISEFGSTGFMVHEYVKALCYGDNGYWVKYDDGFCFDVADVLKSGITENSVKEILRGCFRMSLFDDKVFKAFRIITSRGIQKRYLLAKKNGVIDEKLRVMDDETTENDHLSTQSKVKESKGKESKEFVAPSLDEVIEFFKLKGYTSSAANKAFEYYATANWEDSKGNKVKNWKQKMIANWLKDEYKEKSDSDEATKRIKEKLNGNQH